LIGSSASDHNAGAGRAAARAHIVNPISDGPFEFTLAVDSDKSPADSGHIKAHDVHVSAGVIPDLRIGTYDLCAPLLVGEVTDAAAGGAAGAAIDHAADLVCTRCDVYGHARLRGVGPMLNRRPGMAAASVIRITPAGGYIAIERRAAAGAQRYIGRRLSGRRVGALRSNEYRCGTGARWSRIDTTRRDHSVRGVAALHAGDVPIDGCIRRARD